MVGFIITNPGKYGANFDDRSMLKDDSGIRAFYEIHDASTCKPPHDYLHNFSIEPGKTCELWLEMPSSKRHTNFDLNYKVLGKKAKAQFIVDIK